MHARTPPAEPPASDAAPAEMWRRRGFGARTKRLPQMLQGVSIIPFTEEYRGACAGILRRLPDWFGIESANEAYIAALGRLPTFVALLDGSPAGFIAVEDHLAGAAEIHVLAVAPELHRHGIGTELMRHAESSARARGRTIVHVKTLGPSHPDPGYARTRAFYVARGYQPLFESTAFWGEDQPTLVLVKLL